MIYIHVHLARLKITNELLKGKCLQRRPQPTCFTVILYLFINKLKKKKNVLKRLEFALNIDNLGEPSVEHQESGERS